MDITECVKRNNFALAQYEAVACCAAQLALFSRLFSSSLAERTAPG